MRVIDVWHKAYNNIDETIQAFVASPAQERQKKGRSVAYSDLLFYVLDDDADPVFRDAFAAHVRYQLQDRSWQDAVNGHADGEVFERCLKTILSLAYAHGRDGGEAYQRASESLQYYMRYFNLASLNDFDAERLGVMDGLSRIDIVIALYARAVAHDCMGDRKEATRDWEHAWRAATGDALKDEYGGTEAQWWYEGANEVGPGTFADWWDNQKLKVLLLSILEYGMAMIALESQHTKTATVHLARAHRLLVSRGPSHVQLLTNVLVSSFAVEENLDVRAGFIREIYTLSPRNAPQLIARAVLKLDRQPELLRLMPKLKIDLLSIIRSGVVYRWMYEEHKAETRSWWTLYTALQSPLEWHTFLKGFLEWYVREMEQSERFDAGRIAEHGGVCIKDLAVGAPASEEALEAVRRFLVAVTQHRHAFTQQELAPIRDALAAWRPPPAHTKARRLYETVQELAKSLCGGRK